MRSPNVYGFLLVFSFLLILLTTAPFAVTSSGANLRTKRSSEPSEEDTKFGVICDAGSSGTRIFVYTLKRNPGGLVDIDTLVYENEPVVKKVTPGLSTYSDKPNEVVEYFTPLLRFAEKHIPVEKLAETDLLIFATAGMRLIPERNRARIIENLRNGLKEVTSLRVTDSNIQVIDGAWEGIYSWIAVNYILGRFEKEDDQKVGMIDMGGASVQIAFEMPSAEEFRSENVFEINLGPVSSNEFKYKLFSTTFLGYGANEGLKKYEESLRIRKYSKDSCSPKGLRKHVSGRTVDGSGDWDTCVAQVSSLIGENSRPECSRDTCFLHHVAAPSVNLSTVQLYGFSEYWYTTQNFGAGGEYDYGRFTDEVRKFCGNNWAQIQEGFKNKQFPNAEFERLETNCFKAAWVTTVLHEGFNVDKKSNLFQSVLKIAGEEMQWALGAMLYHVRYLKFESENRLETIRKSQHLSNTFSFFFIFIVILAVVIIRKLQSDSPSKKYRSLRADSKPDLFTV